MQAGKGRTGVMICAYLLHAKLAGTAAEAMSIYAQQRSKNSSGITVASQKRSTVKLREHLRCEKKNSP